MMVRVSRTKAWKDYPIQTKAYDCMGGYWIKINDCNWKWHVGSIFPTPGASAFEVELPNNEFNFKADQSKEAPHE